MLSAVAGLHSGGTAGSDRHHRDSGGVAPTGSGNGPVEGRFGAVSQSPAAVGVGNAALRHR